MTKEFIQIWLPGFGALLILVNVVGFASMGIDKWLATKQKRRISEKRLLSFAFCFGALGSYLGMKVFLHKTMKKKFSMGVPVLLIVEMAILIALVVWWFQVKLR